MTNTNVQSPIPLQGPGFVSKESGAGKYEAGQMKKLTNLEFIDNTLMCRRQTTLYRGGGGSAGTINNPVKFAESIAGTPGIITTAGVDFGGSLLGSTLPAVATAGYTTTIEQAFEYRDVTYAIALEHESATPSNRRLVIYKVTSTNRFEPNFNLNATRTVINAIVGSDSIPTTDSAWEAYGGSLRGGFIFKDRLFIAVQDKLYWSKVTDPTVWAVPDGGFATFDIPFNITAVAALNDTIYIASADKIFTFTYSVDIDAELVIRQVDSGFGAFDLCSYRGSMYALCHDGIYIIQGSNMEKILDNFMGNTSQTSRLVGFDDYLFILNMTGMESRYDTNLVSSASRYRGNFPNTPFTGLGVGTRFYCLNMVTGCLFQFLINWPDPTQGVNYVTDLLVSNDINGNSAIWFLLTAYVNTVAGINSATAHVLTSQALSQRVPIDFLDPLGTNTFPRVPMEAEFDQFCPDGNEHLVKKFRNLLIEGVFPGGAAHNYFKTSIAYDNKAYKTPVVVEDNSNFTARPPYPHRLGLNQRARAINIRLFNDNLSSRVPIAEYSNGLQRFLVSDLRLLWSYTQRVMENAEQSKTP